MDIGKYKQYARALRYEAEECAETGLVQLAASYKESARIIQELVDKLEDAERRARALTLILEGAEDDCK